ncbi:MAG: PAS domain-containing protein, partial [Actinomycetales bacterium]
MRITNGGRGSDPQVVVDPRLSVHQVMGACQQLGTLGWSILGAWCSLMRPSLGPAPAHVSGPTALGIVAPDRIVRWFSPDVEALLGWTNQSLVGCSVMVLAHPEQQRQATAIRNRVDDDGHGQGTLLVRTVDGGYRAIHSTVTTISTLSGEPAFILGEW